MNNLFDNSMDSLCQDVHQCFIEAKDNARFLSTVDRHMKNITFGTTFTLVTETLPNLLMALRMVWIISRHYNTDNRMVPMMERIAWQLCERVTRIINIKTLFEFSIRVWLSQLPSGIRLLMLCDLLCSDEPSKVIERCLLAKKMLDVWKQSYFNTRAKIEESGRDSRWEFDRKRLFDRTKYMAKICSDLAEVAEVGFHSPLLHINSTLYKPIVALVMMSQTLDEFRGIFTDDLRRVTGEVKLIDGIVAKVNQLVIPISSVSMHSEPVRVACTGGLYGWPVRVACTGGLYGWPVQVACRLYIFILPVLLCF